MAKDSKETNNNKNHCNELLTAINQYLIDQPLPITPGYSILHKAKGCYKEVKSYSKMINDQSKQKSFAASR